MVFELKTRPTHQGHDRARRTLAAVARRGRASLVELLPVRQTSAIRCRPQPRRKRGAKNGRDSTARGLSRAAGRAKRLVVFAARLWRRRQRPDRDRPRLAEILPDTAFVSPHAPEPCGQAPVGRQWFPLTFRDPNERWTGVQQGRARARAISRQGIGAPAIAAVCAGPGRLQPRHDDVAACRPAPRGRARGDRRLFRHVRSAERRADPTRLPRRFARAAGAADPRRPR